MVEAPLGGTQAQAMHRLQIGLGGVLGIVMLVGLVGLIQSRADETEQLSVPEAAATSQPDKGRSQPDPLMEAGVVPDLPATPTPTATQQAPILPEQGIAPSANAAGSGPNGQ
ncbi:MAG: hypothetical protein ACR2FJ_04825 [Qipengyuania sp.]